MILKNSNFKRISNKQSENVSMEGGEDLAVKLFNELTSTKRGVGLAAVQIGYLKNVCVVNVKKPIYFINPKIIDSSGEIGYMESCLSFPGKNVRTIRYKSITVEADNFDEPITYEVGDELDTLECVAIQHEIGHCNGKTIFDVRHKIEPIKSGPKYRRNEIVKVKNNITGEVEVIKYKKVMNDLGNDKTWMVLD